jgi:hypothetical protein
MIQNIVNTAPYLRTSREFPFDDIKELAFEVNKSYVDIATTVNQRVIGIFSVSRPAITGENWFFNKGVRQQSLRQSYPFNSTSNIAHNIPVTDINYFSRGFGAYTDGTNWYGLIFGSTTAIPGQISFYITPSTAMVSGNIVFVPGSGPSPPSLTKGIVVLEWISQT